jgi:uncharacterized protein
MISVPIHLVRYEVHDGEIVPWFLGRRDVPWLRDLIELFEAFVGEPRRALESRLMRSSQTALFRLAVHVMWQLYPTRVEAAVSPRAARSVLFVAAAANSRRDEALAAAADKLGIDPEPLLAAMLADLPGARVIGPVSQVVGPDPLALWCNTAIILALARRAIDVRLEVSGNARAVVRQAKLHGLICSVEGRSAGDACRLSLAGPLSALAQTTRYGHALARLIPVLPWTTAFRFEARCRMGGEEDATHRLVLTKGSPIEPGAEPRRFDSAVEARFARDFARATEQWVLVREPEPVEAADKLIFPDFEIRQAADPSCRWWIEIVGFWTRDYLEQKAASLRAARLDRLILCVDEARACEFGTALAHHPDRFAARFVWFRRFVDVGEVLAAVHEA